MDTALASENSKIIEGNKKQKGPLANFQATELRLFLETIGYEKYLNLNFK